MASAINRVVAALAEQSVVAPSAVDGVVERRDLEDRIEDKRRDRGDLRQCPARRARPAGCSQLEVSRSHRSARSGLVTKHLVVAATAINQVRAGATENPVRAAQRVDRVIARKPTDLVVGIGAVQRVVVAICAVNVHRRLQ